MDTFANIAAALEAEVDLEAGNMLRRGECGTAAEALVKARAVVQARRASAAASSILNKVMPQDGGPLSPDFYAGPLGVPYVDGGEVAGRIDVPTIGGKS